MTTIYEVLGSSVTVPHYGSKTIRVKLTVSPDQRKHVSATLINNRKENKEQPNVAPAHHQQKKKKSRERRHHQCCHHAEDVANNSDESDVCSRISGYEAEDIDDDQLDSRCLSKRPKKQHHLRVASSKYTIPNLFIREKNLINRQEAFMKNRKLRRKSSTLQRQELFEIIQANMEKNNLCFQTPRWVWKHIFDLHHTDICLSITENNAPTMLVWRRDSSKATKRERIDTIAIAVQNFRLPRCIVWQTSWIRHIFTSIWPPSKIRHTYQNHSANTGNWWTLSCAFQTITRNPCPIIPPNHRITTTTTTTENNVCQCRIYRSDISNRRIILKMWWIRGVGRLLRLWRMSRCRRLSRGTSKNFLR